MREIYSFNFGKFNMVIQRDRQFSLSTVVVFFIFALGLFFRIRQYLSGRSLWLDEAMLALNIANHPFVELTQPLDYDQGAPIGFLFLQKFVIQSLGNKDYTLRLFPLIAGIIAMFLMYRVARTYISLRGALIALGMLAVSSPLIYYASEAKQYSSDVMISLILLLFAYKCMDANATLKHFMALAFIGVMSLLMSHPALFVMTGVGVSLALNLLVRKDTHKLLWLAGVFLFWGVSFAILYFVSLRFLAMNETLLNYWVSGFMPMPPWRNIEWFYHAFFAMLRSPVGLTSVAVSGILFFLGCLSFFFRSWQSALVLTIPFLTTLIASGLGRYPFKGRLLLFIVPLVILLVTEGLERVYLVLRKHHASVAIGVWIILGVLLLYKPVEIALQNLENPIMKENIKPALAYLKENRLVTDSIYVYYGVWAPFLYYAPSYGFEFDGYTIGIASRDNPVMYIQDIDKLNGQGRVWFLFSHTCSQCKINEKAYFLDHLNKVGVNLDKFESTDSSVYLYNFDISGS